MNPVPLRSGSKFDLSRHETAVFNIKDIAASLSKMCVFNGHTREMFSVAQHCVIGSHQIESSLALNMLMSEAACAYTGYVPPTLLGASSQLRDVHTAVQQSICRFYGIPESRHPAVEQMRSRLDLTVFRDLIRGDYSLQNLYLRKLGVLPLEAKLSPWFSSESERSFLTRFIQLFDADAEGVSKDFSWSSSH